MGDSILGNVVALILGLFLLFIGPIYDAFETTDKLVDNMANSTITSFQKEVRKNGYIDMDSYYSLISNLNRTGRVYKVTLIHTSNLVYPSTTVPNDYEIHKMEYGTEYILNSIADNGKYFMSYGDDFKVLITENEVAPSRMLLSMISRSTQKLLMFSSGGMVENEVYE